MKVTLDARGRSRPLYAGVWYHLTRAPTTSPPFQAVIKGLARTAGVHPSKVDVAVSTFEVDSKPWLLEDLPADKHGRRAVPAFDIKILVNDFPPSTAAQLEKYASGADAERLCKKIQNRWRLDRPVNIIITEGKELK